MGAVGHVEGREVPVADEEVDHVAVHQAVDHVADGAALPLAKVALKAHAAIWNIEMKQRSICLPDFPQIHTFSSQSVFGHFRTTRFREIE